MKNIPVFSLLLVAIFSRMIFAGEVPKVSFFEMQMRTWGREKDQQIQSLIGKEIVVRVYNDLQSDSRAYQIFSIPLTEFSMNLDSLEATFPEIRESSVIVIVEEDQADEVVAAAVAGSVYTENYGAKKRLNIALLLSRNGKEIEKLIFTDALGNPISEASVEIFLKETANTGPEIYLRQVTTDEKGQLDRPSLLGNMKRFSFTVSHPDYGIAVIESRSEQNIYVPLVHWESEAYQRSIRGVIVDPEGNPVAGAVIQCQNVRTLGEGLINELGGGTRMSITDKNGEFSYYLPNKKRHDERGYLIPPKSQYHVRIEAPKELGLVPYTKPIENSRDVTIAMERGNYFKSFVFEDANGPITDPDKLRYISFRIYRSDKSRLNLMYDDYKDGGMFPPGEYKATMRGIEDYEFEPLTVNEYSPEELVFRLPQSILYYGQVIHGFTGEPISGAFVVGSHSGGMNNLSMITAEQWQALHALPPEASMDDPAFESLRQVYNFKTIIRTNEQGWFQMKVQPREFVEFTAFDENFLGFKHRCHIVRSEETGYVKLPVIKLFPAATVVFEPCAEERISIWPRWIIDEKNNPSKVHEFLAADDRRDNMFTYDRLLRPNEVRSIHIPAGLNVRVKLDSPYDEKWCPVEIPQLFNLEQGQVVDPGSYTFKPALVVSVEVINSQGQTVEGIPVRRLKDNRIWSVAHNTDESGIARFYVVPNTEGQFGVSYHDADGEYLRETIPYIINGEEDAGKEFSLQLSDEILKYFFKSEIME